METVVGIVIEMVIGVAIGLVGAFTRRALATLKKLYDTFVTVTNFDQWG